MKNIDFINNIVKISDIELIDKNIVWKENSFYEDSINDIKENVINIIKRSNSSYSNIEEFMEFFILRDKNYNFLNYTVILNKEFLESLNKEEHIYDVIDAICCNFSSNDFSDDFNKIIIKKLKSITFFIPSGIVNKKFIKDIEQDLYFIKKHIIEYDSLEKLLEIIEKTNKCIINKDYNDDMKLSLLAKLPFYYDFNDKTKLDKFKLLNEYKDEYIQELNVLDLYDKSSDNLKYMFSKEDMMKYKNVLLDIINNNYMINLSLEDFCKCEIIHEYNTLKIENQSKLDNRVIYSVVSFILSILDEDSEKAYHVIEESFSNAINMIDTNYFKFINKPLTIFCSSSDSNECRYKRYVLHKLKIRKDL